MLYGNFCCNYFCIFYWYEERHEKYQLLTGLPLNTLGTICFIIFNTLCFLSILAHWRAAWSDPGVVPRMKEPPGHMSVERVKYCRKCDMHWKPERAHHCSECGVCIFKMDHHCPWVNNCVGGKNMKFFLQFVLYTCLASAMLVVMMLLSFYNLMVAKSRTHSQKEVSGNRLENILYNL